MLPLPFVIESVLGHGGMGTVYRARQTTLGDRVVALKVLPRSLVSRDPKFADRFRREATLAATIDHPSIAKVYLLEEVGGDLCFAMQLVEGPTLHDVLARLASTHQGPQRATSPEHVRRCVHLARALTDALAKIHDRGLVHRDVKPANVLLERAAAPDADPLLARPVLVDFGLLRPVGDTDLTGTNTTLGTPAYASPDAVLGRDLDARADVFSLGATLYDLLTLTLPNSRRTAAAGLPDARTINPAIDERLAAILAMALQDKKALRYEHAGALRDELDRYLRGEPVRALPASVLGRLRLWVRRDKPRALGIAAASVMAMVGLVVAGLVGGWIWRTNRLADEAARFEQAGQLTDAFDAYRMLADATTAARTPWLGNDLQRGRDHWSENGILHAAVKHLRAAEEALARGPAGVAVAEVEWERANDRLIEVLLGDLHRPVAQAVLAFLHTELKQRDPKVRVRIALDSFADYLLVAKAPQPLPADLFALVRSIALGEGDWQPETREAATSVLATTRSVAAFTALIDVLIGDPTEPAASIAQTGADHVYRWLHRDDRAAHAMLGARLLERWAEGVERQAARFRSPAWTDPVIRRLAWWERMPEPPFTQRKPLALSSVMRAAVNLIQQEQTGNWRVGADRILGSLDSNSVQHPLFHGYMHSSGRGAEDYEGQIWLPRANDAEEVQLDTASRDPSPTWNGIRFMKGAVAKERLGGTVRAGFFRAASIKNWDNDWQAYLKLDRPGHSMLQLTTDVPRDAVRMEIRVLHMVAARSILRRGGVVAYQVRVGEDWQQRSVIDAHSATPHLVSTLTVDRHVFAGRDQVDITLDYLHGNTTYRVTEIELRWSFSQK